MSALGTWKFRLSNRSWLVMVALLSVLAISICWNLYQSRLIAEEHKRILVTESAVATHARVEAERAEARQKRNAKWAASDARLQELYREIDTLSRVNERVLSRSQATPKPMAAVNNPAEMLSPP